MAFHYKDVAGKEKELKYIPGYEMGWDVPAYLVDDYPGYSRTGIADAALRLGYYMGVEAQKHAAAEEKAGV